METLVDGRAFLEGPRWHDGALWVSDMHAHEVLRVAFDGDVSVVASLDGPPSGLGWLPDGRMLVVSMHDRRVLRLEPDGDLTEAADCTALAPNEINDMCVDRHGHAFISQFGFDFHGGAPFRDAPLLRVDPDGSVRAVTDGLRMANGIVITADQRTLVVAQSMGKDLVAFDLADDGTLGGTRTWAPLPDYPDGICIDAEDAVWIASPVSDRFVRVREGGEVLDTVECPGRHAIACALGGDDGRTLFCCTSTTVGEPALSAETRGSRLETARVAVPAAGVG
ncbi:MAG TPA: SMP-30/gluconolactonase/LRE family protein [Acidimicrobiia bacterium]|nr:SMP-30/gluconolactonase/LRE family protein [Acidimicrobiia bacterium]